MGLQREHPTANQFLGSFKNGLYILLGSERRTRTLPDYAGS
jgi:hypothetical protein